MKLNNLLDKFYNPDVLECLANLSNDEIFTPPEVANKMIDLLPQDLFKSPDTKFLDPACKSGIFLREIAKRLIVGLEDEIPDLQERLDHIYHKQLFGIGITELTSLMSRRTLYYTKYPQSPFSVSQFDNPEGNILFHSMDHTWEGQACKFCGASKKVFDREEGLELHAYEFIHTYKPEEIFNMKFDVIIGNPPYQLTFGIEGTNSSNAKSIYNLFISQAMRLTPKYLVMITPSRWMTKTSQGIPDAWVDEMLQKNNFKEIHDYEDSSIIFPGVEIKGGVNYFLWENDYNKGCKYYYYPVNYNGYIDREGLLDHLHTGIVVRDPRSYKIIEKIVLIEGEYYNSYNNFSNLVSPKHFFDDSKSLTSNWSGYSLKKTNECQYKYYVNKNMHKVEFAWISRKDIPKNFESVKLNKVFIPAAGGTGNDSKVLGTPFLGEENSIGSQTYLVIGYDPEKHNFSKEECENIITYIKTKFFRYLVSVKKKTQNGPRGVYQFVPMQDFSKAWTDEELYEKYNLSQDEIDFIESMIRPMDQEED